ncbi:MAG: flavin reductase family protein [Acetobacteraceae bacterium]|nr:flavin reductase family protein [Acetobacteraceae bacterium]
MSTAQDPPASAAVPPACGRTDRLLELDDGAPPDRLALRRAFGRFATGVTVVTGRGAEPARRPVGVTANSFSSVSLDPPLVLWSLDLRSSTRAAFLEGGWFAVHVLGARQAGLSARFAAAGGADKFDSIPWQESLGGLPLLPEALALFECRLHQAVEAGDHVVLIGRVLRARYREDGAEEPLLFVGGGYRLPGAAIRSPERAAA